MLTWTNYIANSELLTKLYGFIPTFATVDLVATELGQNSELHLSLEASKFPASPPPEWAKDGLDQVKIRLTFKNVKNLTLSGRWNLVQCKISDEPTFNRQRIVWRKAKDPEVFEAIYELGHFDSVAQELMKWASGEAKMMGWED